jgi:hypothetical protein
MPLIALAVVATAFSLVLAEDGLQSVDAWAKLHGKTYGKGAAQHCSDSQHLWLDGNARRMRGSCKQVRLCEAGGCYDFSFAPVHTRAQPLYTHVREQQSPLLLSFDALRGVWAIAASSRSDEQRYYTSLTLISDTWSVFTSDAWISGGSSVNTSCVQEGEPEACVIHLEFLMGGLGNQLFQVFAVLAHALRHKCVASIVQKPSTWGSDGSSVRGVYGNSIFHRVKFAAAQIVQPDIRVVESGLWAAATGNQYAALGPRSFTAFPPPLNGQTIALKGYFQNLHYFRHEAACIINELGLRSMQDQELIYMLRRRMIIADVALHFRRGDFHSCAPGHILGTSYYMAALAHLFALKGGANAELSVRYYYEAQDATQVQQVVAKLSMQFPSLTFFAVDTAIPDWQQLLRMSLSRYIIIANSSFSWWAAFLKHDPDGAVLYPEPKWWGISDEEGVGDLFPPGWESIQLVDNPAD